MNNNVPDDKFTELYGFGTGKYLIGILAGILMMKIAFVFVDFPTTIVLFAVFIASLFFIYVSDKPNHTLNDNLFIYLIGLGFGFTLSMWMFRFADLLKEHLA